MAGVTPSAASVPPPEDVGAQVRAAQDALHRSVALAGLEGDPLRVTMEALSAHLDAQHAMHRESERTLAELVRAARQPISEDSLKRLEQAAVTGADRRSFGIIREHWRRNVLLAAGVLFGIAVAFGAAGVAGGYAWGRASALALVRHTDAELATMFRNGPDAAATWLNLAMWNDPKQALAQCKDANTDTQDGRRACMVPLWIEPPKVKR